MNSTIQAVPALQGVAAYAVPRHRAEIDLFLDGNEGVHPPKWLLEALQSLDPEAIRRYPGRASLEAVIANRVGVSPEQVIVTAGADDALDRIIRAVLSPGRELVLPSPTFEMIARYARNVGAEIREVNWSTPAYPVKEVCAAITPKTTLVAVVTPNNPTGAAIGREDLETILRAAPHAVVLIDHAYAEFADEDFTSVVHHFPNAVVVRTLSKAYGLAGLRVGYAIGPKEVIRWMKAAGGPYAVAGPSLFFAAKRLTGDGADVTEFVSRVKSERSELTSLLSDLGVESWPSQGNFCFMRSPRSSFIWEALGSLGISVRRFPTSSLSASPTGTSLLETALRISCPGEETAFRRLVHALSSAIEPETILFDMDGVLADVSSSYRTAIIETARSFGVNVTPEDISQVKAEGNANNDWEVSRRLVERAGVSAPIGEVTRRFEEIYQGTEDAPGVRRHEKLLVSREFLATLSKRLPLGIVTGRPRSDAIRFLEEQGIAEYFRAVVCMEDGPLKPNPAPVQRALKELGVGRAWLVGDTRDDIIAARAAGVVPIGTVSSAEGDRLAAEGVLLDSGAARLVQNVEEITDLL